MDRESTENSIVSSYSGGSSVRVPGKHGVLT